jgi:hypothetical protein
MLQSNIAINRLPNAESNAGASDLAGFIDAPDMNPKKKISKPIIPLLLYH